MNGFGHKFIARELNIRQVEISSQPIRYSAATLACYSIVIQ